MKEDEKIMVNPSKGQKPVLLTSDTEDGIVVTYTPATYYYGEDAVNTKLVYHGLFLVKLNGKDVNINLGAKTPKDVENTLELGKKSLITTLIAAGAPQDAEATGEIVLRSSVSNVFASANMDADAHIPFTVYVEIAKGSPYAEYTQDSPWGVTGSLSNYGINWDKDLNMWTDGTNHVAAHVALKAGDEFKFRKDQGWDVNLGGEFAALDAEFEVTQGGANIKIATDGVYDLFVNPDAGTAIVSLAYDPYPDLTEVSTWSVIGALMGTNWDADFAMVTNGTVHCAFGITLDADSEFKFRKDADWGVNLGGEFTSIGADIDVTQGGANIKVGAAGVYDLFVTPDAGVAVVNEACGLKISAIIGGDEPEPQPEPVKGWNIIGLNGDWDNDILATNDGDIWTAYITAEGDTEFKWRKDGGWDENYGGVMVALGEPFEAVAGGDDIKLSEGFYKVVLDVANLTITVSDGNVWSLIGDFNEWAGDVDMVLTDGKWVSPATKLEGGFKIRHNHGWDENVGGTFVAVGEPFAAVAGGDNITVEAGTYVVTYDPTAATITVDELGWGLVGTINSWGGSPDIILKEDGLFLVAKNVALTASDEIKLRYNQDWGVNRGGKSVLGLPVKAVADGDNIKIGVEGTYDVYYRPDCDVIIVNEAGTEISYWGVVGTINSWNAPDIILYVNDDQLLESDEIELTATDEIKIRQNEDWGVNRGGAFASLGEPFAVELNGANIALGRDAKVKVVYDALNETITLNGEFTGDAPAFPDNIFAIGSDTGWSGCYQLSGKNGQYKGFGYLSGEFKFKPNEDNWDGDWECTGEGQIGQGDDNCPAPETAGYYMIEVDLNEMTYQLTLINGIGVIGPAQAGGWDADTDLVYNSESGAWEGTVTFTAGEMKFRANDGWAINWGGALDALVQDGGNIVVEAGTYDVKLYAWCDGKAYATLEAAAAAEGIKIDGEFDDWADIEALSGNRPNGDANTRIKEWKMSSDASNIYAYFKITKSKITNSRYFYVGFDFDKDESTGTTHDAIPGLEAYVVVYPAVAGSDPVEFVNGLDPQSKIYDNNSGSATGLVTVYGVEDADDPDYVLFEMSIPRDKVGVEVGAELTVASSYNNYTTGKREVTL